MVGVDGEMEKRRVWLGGLIGALIKIQSTFLYPCFTLLHKQCAVLRLKLSRSTHAVLLLVAWNLHNAFSAPPPPHLLPLRRALQCKGPTQRCSCAVHGARCGSDCEDGRVTDNHNQHPLSLLLSVALRIVSYSHCLWELSSGACSIARVQKSKHPCKRSKRAHQRRAGPRIIT